MCDTLREKSGVEKPEYVYKICGQTDSGALYTPVLLVGLKMREWNKAPRIAEPNPVHKFRSLLTIMESNCYDFAVPAAYFSSSSKWAPQHLGRWASFATIEGAMAADIVHNGKTGRKCIVKCEIRGEWEPAFYREGAVPLQTFLCEEIKPVEVVNNY